MNDYGVKLSDKGLLIEIVKRREDESLLAFCYRAIGCDIIEVVFPKGLNEPYCMVVDEEGLLRDKPMLNIFASYLYGSHEHGQPIVGNALIMRNVRMEDGMHIDWLSKEEAEAIASKLGKSVLRAVGDLNAAIQKGVL